MALTEQRTDLAAAVERIRPIIEEYAADGEANRRLAPPVVEAMREAGLFRMWVPAAYGGDELHPAAAYDVFEAVSAIDGAAGWNLNQSAAVCSLASWCHDGLDELFADPDAAFSGVFWPPGTAVEVDGGFTLNARVRFSSGAEYSTWFLAAAVVVKDGEPVIDPDTGQPDFIATFVHREEIEIIDTWWTMGMRGTGSNDSVVTDVFVPSSRAVRVFADRSQRPSTLANPLYALPPWTGVQAHAAVPLGIARTAVDRLVTLVQTKVPNFIETPLKEKHVVQSQAAQAKAAVESASVYLKATATDALEAVEAGTFADQHKIALQLAATNATTATLTALNLVHQAAGTSSIRDDAGFEKLFRDAHTITQHAAIQTARYESTGKVMFGLETDWFPFVL